MPGMNGFELADELKKEKENLKIILGSGYSDKKVSKSKIKEKGYLFIQKPYDMMELLKEIHDSIQ